ncbi:endonuclease/exonuclease/phosphatase family protein [Epibacterium sp. Ofav1-8]|uniref:endonuclease/exonuclease/phosphatase family protein n=1 Tax=Epibacterium sp. Ofav1-8 TaxID=2917735 RepID=UPI001EF53815|nr:endonuclease/exonuclease/phosphatase family protein [Epibacterium sp. Ofav1-8]MCG7622478.1 endonuclease [Epibacterium sp. Ofav1-8]
MLKLCRVGIWALLILAILSLAGGFMVALHPLGDSLAVFRVPFAGLAMICAFILRHDARAAMLGAVASGVMLVSWLGHSPTETEVRTPQITLYQKNMLWRNNGNETLIEAIRISGADVVTLEEISRENMPILGDLRADYPVQQFCPFRRVGGVAVLARGVTATNRLACAEDLGLAAMEVEGPTGRFWVAALHLPWPWPHEQAEHVDRVVKRLETLDGPVILAGDFNAVGWSHAVAQIGEAGGMARVGPYAATFDLPPLGYPIGIDHVLAPGGEGEIEIQPKLASDHHGVLAHLPWPDAPQ